MAKSTKGNILTQISTLDLGSINEIADAPVVPEPAKTSIKTTGKNQYTEIREPKPRAPKKKEETEVQTRKKGTLFNTDEAAVLHFKKLAVMKLAKSPGQRLSASAVFTSVLHAMHDAYGELLAPSVQDLAFYTNSNTKHSNHQDIDLINKKVSLMIVLGPEDRDLLYRLMHTFYRRLDKKPTRYSISFFFFEIVRFFEANFKNI